MSKHWRPDHQISGKVAQLRARDGDNCWLCCKPIDFDAEPNSAKAWTVEHLIPHVRQGSDALENLVLCHPGCNRILGVRSLTEKIKLRERRRRKLWIASLSSQ